MGKHYLDNSATTRVDGDIAALAANVMTDCWGNPSSLHSKGLAAQLRVDFARRQLASAVGCAPEEIIFTGSGTEANNLAIFGGAGALARRGKTLVAAGWEHSSVLEPLRQLEKRGFTLRLVNPDSTGHLDPAAVAAAVDEDTILVSCMLVNSEVGGIAPVGEIAGLIRRKNSLALLHCDAVQAFGKLRFSPAKLGVDLLTVSAHKLHAPKGVGALYIRRGVRVLPVLHGGGQENALRPGTESVPLICAFGAAAEKQAASLNANLAHAGRLREYFLTRAAEIPGLCVNSPADGTPYICNISLPGYKSETMLHFLAERGVYVSSGSACAKGAASHVLAAMGLPADRADSALRISFCKDNTTEDIDALFAGIAEGIRRLAKAR